MGSLGIVTYKPARYGRKVAGYPRSEKALAGIKAKYAKRVRETFQNVKQEIVVFLGRKGLGTLSVEERRSRTSIAQAILRKGGVRSVKSQDIVVMALVSLAKGRKITGLPGKSARGGLRKKKENA